MMKKKKTETT